MQQASRLLKTVQQIIISTFAVVGRAVPEQLKAAPPDQHHVSMGHVLRLEAVVQTQVQVYISFGGLLMQLTGDVDKLQELQVDANVYLLMRTLKQQA